MAKIIRDGALVEVDEIVLPQAEEGLLPALPLQGKLLVSVQQYQAQREVLRARGNFGISLGPDDDVEVLADDASRLSLIVIHFPAFTDGRGFSNARLLRERYGFIGELRASGDVFKDTLHYLWRCGFNSFALKEGKDLALALAGLADFSESYQPAANQPLPLFRRR